MDADDRRRPFPLRSLAGREVVVHESSIGPNGISIHRDAGKAGLNVVEVGHDGTWGLRVRAAPRPGRPDGQSLTMSSNSTSKIKVARGGIVPRLPRSP